MAVLNMSVAGVGLPSGSFGPNSANAVTVTQTNDVFWFRQNAEPGGFTPFSGQGVGTYNTADQFNAAAKGIRIWVVVTAFTGTTPTLTVAIQEKDPASGNYDTILVTANITGVGTTILTVYPGLTAAANSVANNVLPRTWRIQSVVGGTTPALTATIGICTIV